MKNILTTYKSHPIYNFRFGMVCISSLLFSASYNMLIPELPSYLTSLGGVQYIGYIIALFTLTAGLSRPFSGRLTDTIGRIPIMVFGTLVCVFCGLLYPAMSSILGFLVLRLFHGFSTGFKPTATSAYVADITPKQLLGTAMGMQSLFYSTGMAIGPALGSLIKLHWSFDVLFYISSVFALLSMLVIINMPESLQPRKKFKWSILKIGITDVIERRVLPAAFITLLVYSSFGVVLTIIPDYTIALGIVNKGMFFIVFTIASLLIRFIAGKASDIYGREPIITIGLLFLVISTVVLGIADNVVVFIAGAVLYGFAMGGLSPSLNAWTIDMSVPEARGKAMATMFIALEAGIGLGAFLAGAYYNGSVATIGNIFIMLSVVSGIGIVYMLMKLVKKWNKK